jgi:hypothetical protein
MVLPLPDVLGTDGYCALLTECCCVDNTVAVFATVSMPGKSNIEDAVPLDWQVRPAQAMEKPV